MLILMLLNTSSQDSSSSHAHLMPNPLREKSGGRMVLSVPLIVFMDDVSGNISKQWNKHHVVYMSNAAMPREMLEKEFCVRFVSSSPHAAPLELMRAMTQSIQYVCSYYNYLCLTMIMHSEMLQMMVLLPGIVNTMKKSCSSLILSSQQVTIQCRPKNAAMVG